MRTTEIQANRKRIVHKKLSQNDPGASSYRNAKETAVKDEDFDRINFSERSKWSLVVWIALFAACIAFWVFIFKLIS